ncbi:MAG: multicopper oxidase family protein [Candidatus Binatia bacterium]
MMPDSTNPVWTRRSVLKLGGWALGASALPSWAIAEAVDYELTAAAGRVAVAGRDATLWTYSGAFPGPVLRLREGERVRLRLTNRLDEPTNLHLHGLHVSPEVDNPFLAVPPGGSTVYDFVVPDGSAGTYWYHPHMHGRVARQLFAGLAGALVVGGPLDDAGGLGDAEEFVVVLKDLSLVDGAPAPHSRFDWFSGKQGDLQLVNGALRPRLTPRRAVIRLRLVNASNARYYRLQLDGHLFHLVATDGGLIERPWLCRELLLAPGERAEVLVRLRRRGEFALLNLPYDRGTHAMGHGHGHAMPSAAAATPVTLLSIRAPQPTEPVRMPGRLRPVASLAGAPVDVVRQVVLSEGMMGRFLINGRSFDPDRVDIRSALDGLEVWELENRGGMDHPFHLHTYPFQVLSRNGVAAPFAAWKDVVNLRPRDRVRIAIPLRDFGGRTVFHCHIAEHEDRGMMGIAEIS